MSVTADCKNIWTTRAKYFCNQHIKTQTPKNRTICILSVWKKQHFKGLNEKKCLRLCLWKVGTTKLFFLVLCQCYCYCYIRATQPTFQHWQTQSKAIDGQINKQIKTVMADHTGWIHFYQFDYGTLKTTVSSLWNIFNIQCNYGYRYIIVVWASLFNSLLFWESTHISKGFLDSKGAWTQQTEMALCQV